MLIHAKCSDNKKASPFLKIDRAIEGKADRRSQYYDKVHIVFK